MKLLLHYMPILITPRSNQNAFREEPSQINVILQQKLLAVKLSTICTLYKQWLYVLLFCWLQWWLKNRCKNTGYYSIFQLLRLLLLNNYQYNCTNTISSASEDDVHVFAWIETSHMVQAGFDSYRYAHVHAHVHMEMWLFISEWRIIWSCDHIHLAFLISG